MGGGRRKKDSTLFFRVSLYSLCVLARLFVVLVSEIDSKRFTIPLSRDCWLYVCMQQWRTIVP